MKNFNRTDDEKHLNKIEKLLRIKEVIDTVGLARSTIYLKLKINEFPKPISVGIRAKRWKSSDIQSWIKNCEQKSH